MNKHDINKIINETAVRGGELTGITLNASNYNTLLTDTAPVIHYCATDTTTVTCYKNV